MHVHAAPDTCSCMQNSTIHAHLRLQVKKVCIATRMIIAEMLISSLSFRLRLLCLAGKRCVEDECEERRLC
jgi:hypothetical protein